MKFKVWILPPPTIIFGSLFAGIGGIDLGLERAGMVCKWQVEIDPFCNQVLTKHWPNVKRYEDVKECGSHNLEPVDLICGGFPCQPHSVAGKRRGAEDDRNLWPEFLRIVREVRPTWVLAENVPGIVSLYLDTVLADLEGEGYTCWMFNIPACAFNAPHRRQRIFIVGWDSDSMRRSWHGGAKQAISDQDPYSDRICSDVANATGQSCNGSDDNRRGRPQPLPQFGDSVEETRPVSSWWAVEPDVGRVAHGIPNRVDRLKALGNAVVPQVAEWIGRQILATWQNECF